MSPAVGLPILAPAVPFLIRLPLGALYTFFSRLWIGYCYKFRIFPAKMGVLRFLKATLRYFFSNGPY